MTICIAAACKAKDGDPLIVVCSDWQYSSDLGSAEVGFKQIYLDHNWTCLFSGDVSAAKTLMLPLKKHFKQAEKIDETNILKIVRNGLNERKRDLAEEFVQGQFAISYDDFLKSGKEILPEGKHREATDNISSIKLGTELIITGFADGVATIVETDEYCTAIIREHFSTIGEGRFLAHSVLMHRAHEDISHLGTTLYRVYEAKKYAERVRSVGPSTSITVIAEEGTPKMVFPSGRRYLQEQYEKYGPKEIQGEIEFDEKYFHMWSGDKT